MKRLFAVLWMFNIVLPAFSFAIPSAPMACAVCDASGHELCTAEGHQCSHARPKAEKKSCCASADQEPSDRVSKADRNAGPTMGHKCARPAQAVLIGEGARYLPAAQTRMARSFHAEASHNQILIFAHLSHHRTIDRPPAA